MPSSPDMTPDPTNPASPHHDASTAMLFDRRDGCGRGLNEGSTSEWLRTQKAPPSPKTLLLKSVDAARILSISPRLLWTLTKRGEIPCIRIGRAVRYDPRDLTTWIDNKKDTTARAHARARTPKDESSGRNPPQDCLTSVGRCRSVSEVTCIG